LPLFVEATVLGYKQWGSRPRAQSKRRACIGSSFAARRAGIALAPTAHSKVREQTESQMIQSPASVRNK
jgi:hypothetical protein